MWEELKQEIQELHDNNAKNAEVEGLTRYLLNYMLILETNSTV